MARNDATINLDPILRSLNALERKNLPFASAQALNETAFDAKRALVANMPDQFDLRSPRPAKGIRVNKANKKQRIQEAVVFHLDEWMSIHEPGGKKEPQKSSVMGIPQAETKARGTTATGKIRPNFYPRNLLKNAGSTDPRVAGRMGGRGNKGRGRAKAFLFQAKNGTEWIAARKKRGAPRMDLAYYYRMTEAVKVPPRWNFFKTVVGVARHRLARNFQKQMAKAVASSR